MITHLVPPALFAALLAAPLAAQSLDGIAAIEVLPGWRTTEGRQMAAFKVTLAPGWKTYWRAPGDAGIPPQFDWTGSENLSGVTFLWPTPDVFTANGMQSIGYHDSVILPMQIDGSNDAATTLRGSVQLGVCEEVCVPVVLNFDAELSTGGTRSPEILAALVDQPLSAAEAGAGPLTCTTQPISDGLRVTVAVDLPQRGASEVVVIESGSDQIWTSETTVDRHAGRLTASADMVPLSGKSFALDRSAIRVTVLGDQGAVDLRGCTAG